MMQKYTFILLLLFLSATLQGQSIKAKGLKKLSINHMAFFPSFGENSNEIFITGQNQKGLAIYYINSDSEVKITDDLGAGNNPEIDKSGNVVFTSVTFIKGRRQAQTKVYNITNKSIQTTTATNDNIKIKVKGTTIEILYSNNKKEIITPVGDVYYIWASISPNQSQVLFTAVGGGTYIADLKGKIIKSLGYLNSPVWLTQDWIVGMNDKDDGEKIISSQIEAVSLKTMETFVLTNSEDIIALYPKVSPTADYMVFHTPEGEIYYANLTIKE